MKSSTERSTTTVTYWYTRIDPMGWNGIETDVGEWIARHYSSEESMIAIDGGIGTLATEDAHFPAYRIGYGVGSFEGAIGAKGEVYDSLPLVPSSVSLVTSDGTLSTNSAYAGAEETVSGTTYLSYEGR